MGMCPWGNNGYSWSVSIITPSKNIQFLPFIFWKFLSVKHLETAGISPLILREYHSHQIQLGNAASIHKRKPAKCWASLNPRVFSLQPDVTATGPSIFSVPQQWSFAPASPDSQSLAHSQYWQMPSEKKQLQILSWIMKGLPSLVSQYF